MPFLVTYNVPNPPPTSNAPAQAPPQPQPASGAVATTSRDVETRHQPPAQEQQQRQQPASVASAANMINGIIPDMAILVNARFALNRQTFTSIRNIISFVFMISAWVGALFGFKSSNVFAGLPGVPEISSGARAMGLEGVARLLERMRDKMPLPMGGTFPANMTALERETRCGYHEVTAPTPNVDAIEQIMQGLTTLYDLENKRLRKIIEALSYDNAQANEMLSSLQAELRDTQRQLNDSRFREFVSNNRWEAERKAWEAEKLELRAQVDVERMIREEQQRMDAVVLFLFMGGLLVLYLLRAWGRKFRRQLRQNSAVKEVN